MSSICIMHSTNHSIGPAKLSLAGLIGRSPSATVCSRATTTTSLRCRDEARVELKRRSSPPEQVCQHGNRLKVSCWLLFQFSSFDMTRICSVCGKPWCQEDTWYL